MRGNFAIITKRKKCLFAFLTNPGFVSSKTLLNEQQRPGTTIPCLKGHLRPGPIVLCPQ
jgi:hypothetical protein